MGGGTCSTSWTCGARASAPPRSASPACSSAPRRCTARCPGWPPAQASRRRRPTRRRPAPASARRPVCGCRAAAGTAAPPTAVT
eukprot:3403986-Prymnesium_polylepis.1